MATISTKGAATLFIAGQVLELGSNIYGGILQNQIYKSNANLAQAQGNYESSVSEYNAAVSRANAAAIRSAADIEIERQKKTAKAFKSGQMAGYASAGVKLTGSPLNVMIDTATEFAMDRAITDYNANIGVMQAQSQGTGFDISGKISKNQAETKASLSKLEGSFKQNQAMLKSGTSLLSSSLDFYKRT